MFPTSWGLSQVEYLTRARKLDVGPLGLGKPVSNAPWELFSTAYDVPAGHRPALVVDTVDPLHIEHNPSGARLTFSSPASDPSYLTVPLREQ